MISRPVYEQETSRMPCQHCSQPLNLLLRAGWSPAHATGCTEQEGSKGENSRAAPAEITPACCHSSSLAMSPSSCWPLSLLLLSKVFPLLTVSSNSLSICHRIIFFYIYNKESFAKSAVKSPETVYPGMSKLNKVLSKFFCIRGPVGLHPAINRVVFRKLKSCISLWDMFDDCRKPRCSFLS